MFVGMTFAVEMVVLVGMGVAMVVLVGMGVCVSNTVVGVLVGVGVLVTMLVSATGDMIVIHMHKKCSLSFFFQYNQKVRGCQRDFSWMSALRMSPMV